MHTPTSPLCDSGTQGKAMRRVDSTLVAHPRAAILLARKFATYTCLHFALYISVHVRKPPSLMSNTGKARLVPPKYTIIAILKPRDQKARASMLLEYYRHIYRFI